ncbi:MAG: TIGR00282 family metallophosphoesterase [Spirochaetales bacterium]
MPVSSGTDDRPFVALMFGDLVGSPGFGAFLSALPALVAEHGADFVVVNAENAASDGLGLLPGQVSDLLGAGVDVITTGNHIWEKKEILPLLASEARLLRPDNYPSGLPGTGLAVVTARSGDRVAVVNLQGRTRLAIIDDPFPRAKELVARAKAEAALIFVDFHAEAPDEKEAFGFWLDGLVTAVVGTHTHVATADERLLPAGTAYLSDLGMCGPEGSVIGGDPQISLERSLTLVPLRSEILEAPGRVRGVVIRADRNTGLARSIVRLER